MAESHKLQRAPRVAYKRVGPVFGLAIAPNPNLQCIHRLARNGNAGEPAQVLQRVGHKGHNALCGSAAIPLEGLWSKCFIGSPERPV